MFAPSGFKRLLPLLVPILATMMFARACSGAIPIFGGRDIAGANIQHSVKEATEILKNTRKHLVGFCAEIQDSIAALAKDAAMLEIIFARSKDWPEHTDDPEISFIQDSQEVYKMLTDGEYRSDFCKFLAEAMATRETMKTWSKTPTIDKKNSWFVLLDSCCSIAASSQQQEEYQSDPTNIAERNCEILTNCTKQHDKMQSSLNELVDQAKELLIRFDTSPLNLASLRVIHDESTKLELRYESSSWDYQLTANRLKAIQSKLSEQEGACGKPSSMDTEETKEKP